MKEQIEHPDYYNAGGIEVSDFIDAYNLNFNRGNIIKYVVRAGRKHGESTLTALLKAQEYLLREIASARREQEMRPAICDPEHYPEDKEYE